MNFEELMKKMKAIDEGQIAEECGAMPIGIGGPMGQQDNVTMNVSMNGSGAGGIRDLMAILKNIENSEHDHGDVLVGEPSEQEPIMGAIVQSMGHEHDMGEEYENSVDGGSEPEVYGIDAITQTGDDMHSKGREAPPVNGGGNPMHEALTSRLYRMYQTIKEDAGQQDLGNGFVLASIEAFGSTRPAVLDTQSNTYYILNQQGNGGAIARTPAKYLTIKDGKTGASMGGPQTDAAFQKAGLIKEAYNPNSVDAEHRRSLEKSQEDSLKKKAEAGDESAKKRLQALKDKKERMRNDYNDRMER